MQFIIENESHKVTVDSRGCELVSVIGKNDGTEYLWVGDPAFWNGHAPTMFPICGRLNEGKFTCEGKIYEMNLHGFARKMEFTIAEKTPSSVRMMLTDSEESLAQYPFRFAFTIGYALVGNTVHTEYKVENRGDTVMPYALGGHPGFNVPLGGAGAFSDYYVEFETECAPRKLIHAENCLLTHETADFPLEGGRILRLQHDMFDNDAIFLENTAKCVTLRSTATEKTVTMRFEDFLNVGFWHTTKSEAPFVCIEPWNSVPAYDGVTDDLMTKRDLTHLAPGAADTIGYSITIGQ